MGGTLGECSDAGGTEDCGPEEGDGGEGVGTGLEGCLSGEGMIREWEEYSVTDKWDRDRQGLRNNWVLLMVGSTNCRRYGRQQLKGILRYSTEYVADVVEGGEYGPVVEMTGTVGEKIVGGEGHNDEREGRKKKCSMG